MVYVGRNTNEIPEGNEVRTAAVHDKVNQGILGIVVWGSD